MSAEIKRALFRGFLFGLAIVTLFFIVRSASAQDADEWTLSEKEIYTVQIVLFEHNIGGLIPDGVMGEQTRAGIADWQLMSDDEPTGYLTREQYEGIIEAGIPTDWQWGAISISLDGVYGSAFKKKNRVEALDVAWTACFEKSKYPDKCTHVTSFTDATGTSWLAAILCETADAQTVYLAARSSKDETVENVFAEAEGGGYSRAQCELKELIASDGSHQ